MHIIYFIKLAHCFFRSHPLIQHEVRVRNEGLFGQNDYFEEDQSDSSCHWLPMHEDENGSTRNMKHGKKASNRGALSKHLQNASSETFDENLSAKFVNKL